MKRITEVQCVCCPNNCIVSVDENNHNKVTGNRCSNGEAFAIHELTNPERRVNAEIRIKNADINKCPVKTDRAVPLDTLKNIVSVLETLEIEAPVYVSQVIVSDLAGTGANLVSCATIQKSANVGQNIS